MSFKPLLRFFRPQPKPATFERIRVRMLSKWFLDSSERCTVIGFTSRVPREGVSTVVSGLARAFGNADPDGVLLIDTSLNSGNKKSHSQSEDASSEFFIIRDEDLEVDIFHLTETCSPSIKGVKRARYVIDTLRAKYRLILVDAGALTSDEGAYWLKCSNYRVLVIDVTRTTSEMLEYQRKEFSDIGIKLDGSILNKRVYPIPRALFWLAG